MSEKSSIIKNSQQARRQLVSDLGRREVMSRLNIKDAAMTNAIKRGLPAKWYAAFQEIADEKGLGCPPELFGMLGVGPHLEATPAQAAE